MGAKAGSSNYNAGQVVLKTRTSHGLTLNANYTYSKALGYSYTTLEGNTGTDNSVQNAYNTSADYSTLYVRTTHHTYEFPIAEEKFEPYAPLADLLDLKSFSVEPQSQQIVYTLADKGGYWTSTLRFALPDATALLPVPIYKTRWVTDVPPTCSAHANR